MNNSATSKYEKFSFFNILKFIGIFSISIYYHFNILFLVKLGITPYQSENLILHFLQKYSFVFVEMMFIISGVLFTSSYMDKIKSTLSFDSFILQRVIRIYPVTIFTIVVSFIENIIIYKISGSEWMGSTSTSDLIIELLYSSSDLFSSSTSINDPLWYVSILFLCYIIAYILTRLSQKWNTILLYIIPITYGIALHNVPFSFPFINSVISRGVIAFFIGVYLGMILEKIDYLTRKERNKLRIIMILELSLAIFLFLAGYGDSTIFFEFCIFPELIILMYRCIWLEAICTTKFVMWLGKISFGIYAWNSPIYAFLYIMIIQNYITLDYTSIWFQIIIISLHLIVAILSYHLYEKKITSWLTKRLSKHLDVYNAANN